MFIRNFLLSSALKDLNPHIQHLSQKEGTINRHVKHVISYIDHILLECEAKNTYDYLDSPQKYRALETILSFLVQDGYSQVSQKKLSQKSKVSLPLINEIICFLEDLGVCHQIKTRRHGKIAPSVYILTLHNNYLKILEYFKEKWALTIDVCSTFTDFLCNNFNKKKDIQSEETQLLSTCHGLDLFNPVEVEPEEKETNSDKDKKLETSLQEILAARLQEMNDFMSEDQKKIYLYMLSKNTNITEKDAYRIALRMPPDVDWEVRKTFEECVRHFEHTQSDVSTPAHFIEMYTNKINTYRELRKEKLKKHMVNTEFDKPFKNQIDLKKLREILGFNS
ncbi:Replicase RepFR55 [Bacillus cereus group sp. N6]|uniref:Replicase RepFR55 n=1 Tax=Bacillus cereus group sp. N6 TaxID=2794583 RepID=UPI0018F79828|nr:Replicase RepFR55 [Bacillus cereus group sp. N6]